MKIKEECGYTANSLENAKILIETFGIPKRVLLTYIPDPWEFLVIAEWPHSTFKFTGFSWNYAGEGPHGLLEFLKMCGDTEVTMKDIVRVNQDVSNYAIFRRL